MIFSDTKGNNYLYSYSKRKITYISELLCLMINDFFLNGNLFIYPKWIDEFGKKLVNDNTRRFVYLRDNGYFEKKGKNLCTQVNPKDLEDSIVNSKEICFELTQKCNLNCTYCCYGELYHHEGNDHSKELNIDVAFCIIDTLCEQMNQNVNRSTKKKFIIGFYGGEPLLNFDSIKNIVEYTESRSSDDFYFEYILTTNGILLDKYIAFFVKYNFSLTISLDGNYENSGYRLTKNGNNMFNVIFNNLTTIKSKYPEYFDKQIRFNTVIHNKNSVKEVVSFFFDIFSKIPAFSEISPIPIREDKYGEFEQIYKEAIGNYEELSTIISKEDYIQLDRMLKNVPDFFYKLLDTGVTNWTDWLCDLEYGCFPSATCLPFTNKIFVSADGRLHLCEHIGYGYSVGYVDLNKKSIVCDRNKLAEQYSKYFSQISSICSECVEVLFCKTCMFQKGMKCEAVTDADFVKKIVSNMDLLRERESFINYS